MDRTDSLHEQLQRPEAGDDPATIRKLDEALSSLAEAQFLLREAFSKAGIFLSDLDTLIAADAAYKKSRESLFSAVQAHNQAVASNSNDFSSARREVDSALTSLQESLALLQSPGVEGLNPENPLSAITGLQATAEKFNEACRKGEAKDVEGHNSMMVEAQAELSSSPSFILESLDLGSWLQASLAPFLEPIYSKLGETRALLSTI